MHRVVVRALPEESNHALETIPITSNIIISFDSGRKSRSIPVDTHKERELFPVRILRIGKIPICMTFALILLLVTILTDGILLPLLNVTNIYNGETALQ